MQTYPSIRRALLTLFDKQGLLPLAQALQQHGIELLSTGGTAEVLRAAGIAVIEISDYTGYPEMMGGRVKTLHPKVHGAILGRRDQDSLVMSQHEIQPIDLVVANFYPFAQTISDPSSTLEQATENIDIGGPTLVRSAAKNYSSVTVLVDPADYPQLIKMLQDQQGGLTLSQRFSLARKAFAAIADYDRLIADYLAQPPTPHQQLMPERASSTLAPIFPATLTLPFQQPQPLRYGENPHQQAAIYRDLSPEATGVANARQLQGKSLSYNNWVDADSAYGCLQHYEQPACAIVKHANPCGVALGDSLLSAYQRAFSCDPTSAFGGIIAFNQPLDAELSQTILEQQFVEVIIAPEITPEALAVLARKPNVRVLACGAALRTQTPSVEYHRISGGLLVQESDQGCLQQLQLQVVTNRQPSAAEWQDARFAWQVAKWVKSNAMIYVRHQATLGIGAGQMSRIDAAKIAIDKAAQAGFDLTGCVLASDAFLPFRDTLDAAAAVGVTCVIQPGGSKRDAEIINAANDQGVAMILTGMRHFRH
jgi:phosphoribosylaminoimidazolecarboxamide formyltransferase/IMP cyclohydrolase